MDVTGCYAHRLNVIEIKIEYVALMLGCNALAADRMRRYFSKIKNRIVGLLVDEEMLCKCFEGALCMMSLVGL